MPRFINWSVGLERRLPWDLYARVDYLNRHGNHVWAYEQQTDGTFLLQTHKEDRYEAEQITLRKDLKRGYPMMVAYTHSKARSNESLDFNIDNFTTGTSAGRSAAMGRAQPGDVLGILSAAIHLEISQIRLFLLVAVSHRVSLSLRLTILASL